MADQDHVLVADIENREDQAVADVVGIIGRGHLALGTDTGEQTGGSPIPGRLQEVEEVSVMGWALRGARHQDKDGLFPVGGDGHGGR